RRIFAVIKRRAAFHAEDEYRLNERKPLRVEGDPRSHPVWRDETAALMATQRLVNLARETGKRIHVLHISTKQEIEYLRDHKDVASCEATPHHLTLAAPECYERLGTRAQMNPARRYNIPRKGRIAAGYDADFTVVDLKRSETITNQWVASRAGWTPYDGMRVTGWPVGTFVRGRRVMWQGEVTTPSTGEPVRFLE